MDYKEYERNYNEYERKIRHIVCIFLSVETIILCNIVFALFANSKDFTLLKYHEISISEFIITPLIWFGLFLIPTILSYISSAIYAIYEGIRIALVVIVDVMLIHSLQFLGEMSYIGILSSLIMILTINMPIIRMVFYQKMLKKYKSSQILEDDEAVINLISEIEKQEQSK